MAKISIYVTAELRRRMDEAEGVNWSPLACVAFEAELARIITQRGAKDMQDVIARLKASKTATSSKAKAAGRELGVEWAKDRAEAIHLDRLEELYGGEAWDAILSSDGAYSIGEEIAMILTGDPECNRDNATSFFSRYVGDDDWMSPEFFDGFAEGALEVWGAVKDQV